MRTAYPISAPTTTTATTGPSAQERGITPLHPDRNHIDIIAQHLAHIRSGETILKPVYQHNDGTVGRPVRVEPKRFAIVEGLLGYHTEEMRSCYDVRVFLAPPEDLRRRWKVDRDCSRRGYTTDQMLAELDSREPDSRAAEIQEAVWEMMQFASHLRTERLGEYTVATELRRSDSLAIVQLLILYHLATAKAAVALGGDGLRAGNGEAPAPPRALQP